MAKTDGFPHDAYRFLISGLRDGDEEGVLERYMGAAQQEFERTYNAIQSLETLTDPAAIRGDLAEFLAAIVGWDQTEGQRFLDGLSEAQFRKLARLSAAIWKTKGQGANLKDLLRIFTGKSAFLGDYFFHRLLLGGGYIQLTGFAGDPWLTGGTYSTLDEYLFTLTINRSGLDADDERLVYDLLNYMLPALEHIRVIYAAFFDDFVSGELGRWEQSSASTGTAEVVGDANRLRMTPTMTLAMAVDEDELETWKGWLHARATVSWDAGATTSFAIRVMRESSGSDYYAATISPTGTVELYKGSSVIATTTVAIVGPGVQGPAFGISVEPTSQVESRVDVFYAGNVVLTHTFTGNDALYTNDLAPQIWAVGGAGALFVDNVMVQAAPWHTQEIGQLPISSYGSAVQDPGKQPFKASGAPPVPQAFEFYDTAPSWSGWLPGGSWALDNFATFQAPNQTMWFSDHANTGPYPAHGTDPAYLTEPTSNLTISSGSALDLSAFDPAVFSTSIRLYLHAPLFPEVGGSAPLDVELQYNTGSGWVTIGSVGASATTTRPIGNIYPANALKPGIGDGLDWWTEEVWTEPTAGPPFSGAILGQSAVRFRFVATSGQPYTTTDFGFAISRFTLFLYRI